MCTFRVGLAQEVPSNSKIPELVGLVTEITFFLKSQERPSPQTTQAYGFYPIWLPDFYLRRSARSSIIAKSLLSEQSLKPDEYPPRERRHRG